MDCPACHAPVTDATANFCEECGAKLAATNPAALSAAPAASTEPPGAACGNCGAGPELIDAQGFCSQCGHQRLPPARDHVEIVLNPGLAGISDRGVKHFRNEDFLTLQQTGGWTAIVVCDGVSNSPRSDEASAAAGSVILDTLATGARAGESNLDNLMDAAIARAHVAVGALAGSHSLANGTTVADLPASTVVALFLPNQPTARELTIGWLGDSRAYFLDHHGGARLLTKDHSYVNEMIDSGRMTRSEALRSKNAHTVTKTLGGALAEDGRPDAPSLLRVKFSEPGWIIVCTDGLWNYAPEPPELAAWIQRLVPPGADALGLCRALVAEALRLGGRDNVTVAALAVV